MTSFYLGLALVLAITINNRFAAVRALGVLVAAVALGFMAWSIVLADLDGTFARAPKGSVLPWLLNGEAVLITLGALLLLWTIPRQFRSTTNAVLPSSTTNPVPPLSTTNAVPPNAVPLRSTGAAYGHLTRGLHWASATLIIAAFTMGQFIAVLAADDPVRADFLTTHMAIGGAIFLLTFARMFERLVRPAPPNPGQVQAAHFMLYALITATCVTGLAMADAPIHVLGLSLPSLPAHPFATRLHQQALPVLFLILIAAHLFGAIKAIRRMARR